MDWLLVWTVDLSRVVAGGVPERNKDFAEAYGPLALAVAPIPLFRYHRTLLRQRTLGRASVATSPRRRGTAHRLSRIVSLGKSYGMADRKAPPAPPGAVVARPGVLSLNIREKAALYAAYMPFLKGGGIFIPTSRQYALGEEVFMLLSLMDDPNRLAVQGKVVWITPEGVQGNRTQGIGVQFTQDDTGAAARATIERVLGETLATNRPTHTM